jgi:hypothetical protein
MRGVMMLRPGLAYILLHLSYWLLKWSCLLNKPMIGMKVTLPPIPEYEVPATTVTILKRLDNGEWWVRGPAAFYPLSNRTIQNGIRLYGVKHPR